MGAKIYAALEQSKLFFEFAIIILFAKLKLMTCKKQMIMRMKKIEIMT